ncbi:MAG: hypothetical protein R3D00_27625 [Bacteroidia bacterium]
MWRKTGVLVTLLVLSCFGFAQSPSPKGSWEALIGEFFHSYAISSDNLFRLAAYSELKGRYSEEEGSLKLTFGELGNITFFKNHCLLRTYRNQVFHLNKEEGMLDRVDPINNALSEIFEKIILLGNQDAAPDFVEFVDQNLARKNMEPFEKVFLRHILLRHGKYDRQNHVVEFYSDWLEKRDFSNSLSVSSYEEMLVRKYRTPLRIRLDEKILRGWYLDAGGTVFVEDVDRPVFYATGEQYDQNVVAFKVFLQKMFVESIQFVAKTESERLQENKGSYTVSVSDSQNPVSATQTSFFPKNDREPVYITPSGNQTIITVEPLYHEFNWIPMMLNILRSRDINFGDPAIIRFFVDEPYFPKIYEQLNEKERILADRFVANQ